MIFFYFSIYKNRTASQKTRPMTSIQIEGLKDIIKIAHISDMHIFKSKQGILKGAVNTFEKFQKVVENIQQENSNIDAVIITGDLSEDGYSESYQLIKGELDKLKTPSFWLPGNHDNFENIPENISKEHVFNSVEIGNWKLIFLDTTIQGVDHGRLSDGELQRLDAFLKENRKSTTLICMHHPPIDVQSEFIDVLGLKNKSDFWTVISKHSNVKGILFGHVHQEIWMTLNNISLSCTPSTCMQWIPLSKEFAFDVNDQGYQLITLDNSGGITTKVVLI